MTEKQIIIRTLNEPTSNMRMIKGNGMQNSNQIIVENRWKPNETNEL